MSIAIVTGASSGLGSEFTQQISEKYEIEEIWVIARRRERLEELEHLVKTPLRILCYDLTQKESIREIQDLLEEQHPDVKLLVNAAGFGKIGSWKDISLEDCENMIDLNCRAAVSMTQIVLPYMTKGSQIIEVASTAGFQSFQFLNVYASSKSFLYRYSRALRVELLTSGIHVTALCPYWIKDTEFIGISQETDSQTYVRHFPLSQKKKHVVSMALRDSNLNLAVSTPGIVCTVHRIAAKIIPSELMMGIWALLRRV